MIDDIIRFQAALNGDAPAFVAPNMTRSFAKMEADIRRAVYELRDFPVPPGEAAAVAIKRPYNQWVVILALARLGIASAPPNDMRARFRITTQETDEAEHRLLLSPQDVKRIISGPDRPYVRTSADPDALGRVALTSGTTGTPKRVAISWRAIQGHAAQAMALHSDIAGPWLVTMGSQTISGYRHAVAAWAMGKSVAAEVGPAAEAIAILKPGLLVLNPVHLMRLLDRFPGPARWPVRVFCGGSVTPLPLLRRLCREFSADVILRYASTEAGQIATATPRMIEEEPRAVGYPSPGVEIRIVDDDWNALPPGATGRFCIRTDRLASGYLDDRALTGQCFRDGWFLSRDLGRRRQDGLLIVEGRTDDVMNLGGHKVSTSQIEDLARQTPGVGEAAAFPFRTETGVDQCGLALVRGAQFDPARLRRQLGAVLTLAQEVQFLFCKSLPHTPAGKVDRMKLQEMAAVTFRSSPPSSRRVADQ